MTSYVLSSRAQADINDIWDFSADTWSVTQADLYVGQIRTAIETLGDDPERGRPHDGVRPGYRKYPVGSHIIFYRIAPDAVQIVRVLHRRMDFDSHL